MKRGLHCFAFSALSPACKACVFAEKLWLNNCSVSLWRICVWCLRRVNADRLGPGLEVS